MKKKILSLFFALCLSLSLIPTSAGAVGAITKGSAEYNSLQQFLMQFYSGWSNNQLYDSQNISLNNQSTKGAKNILEAIVNNPPCALLHLYPGKETEESWNSDPLGKWSVHYKVDAQKVDWTLKNIFNCSQADITALRGTLSNKGDGPYYINGYYYQNGYGVGGMFVDAFITDIQQSNGQTYKTTYELRRTDGSNELVGRFFAIVELKTIDGASYWSLHYNSKLNSNQDPAKTGGFLDVDPNAYYCTPMRWAVEQGITAGTSLTTFSPNATCTKAQILTFLWRANGSPEPNNTNPYSDVSSDSFYYKAALWAYQHGIVAGNTFNPNDLCTRSMAVTYLWRTAGSPSGMTSNFSDIPANAEYAQAVAWAVNRGITSGTGNNRFSPNATCTRGQIVTFLYRYQDMGLDNLPSTATGFENCVGTKWDDGQEDMTTFLYISNVTGNTISCRVDFTRLVGFDFTGTIDVKGHATLYCSASDVRGELEFDGVEMILTLEDKPDFYGTYISMTLSEFLGGLRFVFRES